MNDRTVRFFVQTFSRVAGRLMPLDLTEWDSERIAFFVAHSRARKTAGALAYRISETFEGVTALKIVERVGNAPTVWRTG